MLVRLLANLFINPINIPLRLVHAQQAAREACFAFAARRCPPSKGIFLSFALTELMVKEL